MPATRDQPVIAPRIAEGKMRQYGLPAQRRLIAAEALEHATVDVGEPHEAMGQYSSWTIRKGQKARGDGRLDRRRFRDRHRSDLKRPLIAGQGWGENSP